VARSRSRRGCRAAFGRRRRLGHRGRGARCRGANPSRRVECPLTRTRETSSRAGRGLPTAASLGSLPSALRVNQGSEAAVPASTIPSPCWRACEQRCRRPRSRPPTRKPTVENINRDDLVMRLVLFGNRHGSQGAPRDSRKRPRLPHLVIAQNGGRPTFDGGGSNRHDYDFGSLSGY
jgi:hypothetical protein